MAEEAGCLDLYRLAYTPFSAAGEEPENEAHLMATIGYGYGSEWHLRAGAAAPTSTSTRRQGLRGGDRAPSAQVYVDLADVARALDHRRARCEERTPVATEGEPRRRARGVTIPAKSAAKLTPRPRDTRVSVLSFRSYWARSMPLMWVQCRSARSPSCSWDRP